jgi:hypothetical protein
MYAVFCTITDELGSRCVPTGHAAHLETCADDIAAGLKRSYPANDFWVDWIQEDNGFNY